MKRLFLLGALLLFLLLSGCGVDPDASETMPPAPPLPSIRKDNPDPIPDDSEWFPDKPGIDDPQTGPVPELVESPDGGFQIRGPAGTVQAVSSGFYDPIYAELDGDGTEELLYLADEPFGSGLLTAIYAYGLEDGWPVVKGSVSFLPDGGTFSLCLIGGAPCCLWYHPAAQDGTPDQTMTQLLLVLSGDRIILDGNDRPEEIGSSGLYYSGYSGSMGLGTSFAAFRQSLPEDVRMQSERCVVWRDTSPNMFSSYMGADPILTVNAASSENGVTVTQIVSCVLNPTVSVSAKGLALIEPVKDADALIGLNPEELTQKLGPCHFTVEEESAILCWFTKDGKLLLLSVFDTVTNAMLWDLTDCDSDEIIVYSGVPGLVLGQDRWARFLDAAGMGVPDRVELRFRFDDEEERQTLSYENGVYSLSCLNTVSSFSNLIIDRQTDAPPDAAAAEVYYLLSNDPDMTMERYRAGMFSSYIPFDSFQTRYLFEVSGPY